MTDTNRTLVFASPNMNASADRLVERSPSRLERGAIDWHRFADGTPNVFIHDVDAIDGRDVIFMAALEEQGNYFDQLSTMYEIAAHANPATFTICLPYYPTATMERPTPHGIVVTAESLARLLGIMPPARNGLAEIVVFDPHTETLRGFFNKTQVRVTFRSFMDEIVGRIDVPRTIVFPDKGAKERFERHFPGLEHIVCEKERGEGSKRKVRIVEGDPAGKACLIIDDLVQTGGTLIACAAALRLAGATDVQGAFTHPVFPKQSWKQFTPDVFSAVYTTNSCPRVARELVEMPNFTVIDVSEILFPFISRRR